ncbi:MAG: ATP-binding protein [Bernardetiaceae bacterium]
MNDKLLVRLFELATEQDMIVFDTHLHICWERSGRRTGQLSDFLPAIVVEGCRAAIQEENSFNEIIDKDASQTWRYRIRTLRQDEQIWGAVFVKNITAQEEPRKKLERAISKLQIANDLAHQREQRLKATLNGASEGILILNEDGQINFCNRVAQNIFALEDYQGFSFLELLSGNDQGEVRRFMQQSGESGGALKKEVHFRKLNMSKDFFLGDLSLSKIDSQEIEFVAIVEDISERKAAEEQLKRRERELRLNTQKLTRANQHLENTLTALKNTQVNLIQSEKMSSLGQLTAGIAHELNNPINFMFAGVQALKANFDDLLQFLDAVEDILPEYPALLTLHTQLDVNFLHKDTQRLLHDVQEGAERTANIVKGLLTFSRMNEENYLSINIHDSIRSTLNILRGQLRERVTVVEQFDENLPKIEGLAGKINQVLMNMIVNAADAIPDKGTIHLRTSSTSYKGKAAICIEIQDSGKGIPQMLQNKIFDPFFTTKEVGKGTGLGLYISHGIIERHKGKITLQSKENEGTTFQIILPVNQE